MLISFLPPPLAGGTAATHSHDAIRRTSEAFAFLETCREQIRLSTNKIKVDQKIQKCSDYDALGSE